MCRLREQFGIVLLAVCLSGLWTNLTQAEPRRFALVVGVREYAGSEKLPDLTHTEADANLLAGTLTKSGYQVTLMTKSAAQGDGEGRFLPVAALIRKRFDALIQTPFLKQEDCLVVTLAGHGIQLPSRTDPEKKTYYFCPSDAVIDQLKFSEDVQDRHNLISIQELYDTLEKSGAGVKLLAVDACRNDPNKPPIARAANSVTRPPVPIPPGGIAAYFSCSADQESIEDATLKHGVFTWYLNEALSGKGDINSDQKITLAEIKEYVGLNVYTFVDKKYGRSQLPEMEDKTRGFATIIEIPRPLIPIGTKAGEIWDKNSLNIKFCWCPPGKFTMGSPASESLPNADANQVEVTLSKGFYLGQYEVTQALWEAVMGTTPWRKAKSEVREGTSYPANHVTWQEASEFCVKLTAKGRTEGWLPKEWVIDLPTEAQWEYACRAGTETRWSFGGDVTQLDEFTWTYGNAYDIGEKYAHQVGQKKSNGWGLYDMHGNLYEYCRDWYTEKLHGGIDPEVQEKTGSRVHRGGCYAGGSGYTQSAARSRTAPDEAYGCDGFRVVLVPVKSRPTLDMEKFPDETKAGNVWDKNGPGIPFCWCPTGDFTMGSPVREADREADENQVSVTISQGYWLGQHEVTQFQWQQVMNTTPWDGKDYAKTGERLPAIYIRWEDAMEFCRKLTAQERAAGRLSTDWEYRLPTEAQWEYACRAGTTTATAFGDKLDSTQANFDGNYPYNSAAKGEYKVSVHRGGYCLAVSNSGVGWLAKLACRQSDTNESV